MTGVVEVNEVAAREIERGSLHVFAQNLLSVKARNGDWVEVRHAGRTLGYGFYSERSSIPVKIFSRDVDDPEEAILGRLEDLWKEKKRLYRGSFRWVFAEGDLIPGLIIDIFEDVAALRVNVFGLERLKNKIADLIVEKGVENVVERNDFSARKKEGLPLRKGLLRGRKHRTEIKEGSVRFVVDVLNGQKTGFYLDQRDNRIFSERFSDARRVLDVYSYTGGFGIHLGKDGAEVHFVELGTEVSSVLRENIAMNNIRGRVFRGDAVEVLKRLVRRGERYDVISLDPPALTKGKSSLEPAKKTYFLLNRLAMKLIRPGGILLTSSCSQPLTPRDFLGIIRGASLKEGRRIRILGGIRSQSTDHTYYPPHPETLYLKHIVAVVE